MLIILKHILRNIGEKKGRSLLIIISLLIASCVFILNLTIPNQIVEANKNKARNLIGKSDVIIASYEDFNLQDLKLNNEEINYVGVNQTFILHKDKTITLYTANMQKAKELELYNNEALNNNEIAISTTMAEKFGYKLNDVITVNINNVDYNLKITNISESKGLLYFKPYSGIVNESTFKEINEINKISETNELNIANANKYSAYYIDVNNNDNIDSFNEYVKENNENYITEKLVDEDAIKENTSYISMILLIIFVMAVVMIFFVVNTLNKMIVMERTPVIATFRSIGATKHKMNLILILENAMYGLIGGTLGAILSLTINRLCVKLLLGGESLNTNMPLSNLIYGVIFAIVLEVLMSISAIIKSNKHSIKELMFENQGSKYKLNTKSSIISITLIITAILLNIFVNDNNIVVDMLEMVMFWFGIAYCIPTIMMVISKIVCAIAKKIGNGSLIIAGKNLGYNKMIISSSRLVVISISIMLVIFNVSATFDKMLNSFSYQFEGYDIFIRDTSKEAYVYEDLSKLEEIEKSEVMYLFSSEATYNNGNKFDTKPIVLGMKQSRPDIQEYNYKIQDLKENEILIDEVYAENNKLSIGDNITIKFEDLENEYNFKIVGTVNSFYCSIQREVIVVNENFFTKNMSKVPFQVCITAKQGRDLKDVVSKIEKELKDPDITIMTVNEFVESQRNNIHTIMYLFYIIIGLAVVLAFVGIINNQIISFVERTKELAVLNSVCMSKGQLIRMLIIENIVSNISACIVGFIVSIESVKIISSVLNGIKMYIGLSFDAGLAGIFIEAVLIILLITVIMPIRKLRKINVVEAIKYE